MAVVKIACPKCGWGPKPADLWLCSCGHAWHTFDTAGRCPSCGKQWEHTCSHAPEAGGCGKWSKHLDWYRNLDAWLRGEIEKIRKPVERQVG